MKILLLSVSSTSFFYEQLVIPFGLVSLGSYVESPDFEIKGIDLNTPPDKIMNRYLKIDNEIADKVIDYGPDIIAMSTYASNIYNVMFWADVLKKRIPECFVVVGGNHVSYIAKECLEKCKGIDAVVKFEGEIPFKMLCEKIHNNDRDFSDIPSFAYRKNGQIAENSKIALMKDLNTLPMLNRSFFSETGDPQKQVHADIVSARGCTANCTFCNCNHYWNKTHRTRTVESVIEELKELQRTCPLESVRFRDETLTLRKNYCLQICDAIVSNKIKLRFQAHSRLDGLDEEVIKALSKAGFELLFIGVESGSKTVLKRLKKGIKLSKLETIIPLLRKYGIDFRLSFMSSTPGETFRETLETVKLIKKLKLKRDEYYVGVGIDIYPGTEECDRFLELNPDYEWLSKNYKFKGKYAAAKDSFGNITQPKYREYGTFKSAVIFFLLSPSYFWEKVNSIGIRKLKKIFNLKK
ncbi:MAG: radical SAM protein [Sedimentisphaerales bacterium]|nr:radical SAM protein [Sedimentisphaerales bacterium]